METKGKFITTDRTAILAEKEKKTVEMAIKQSK